MEDLFFQNILWAIPVGYALFGLLLVGACSLIVLRAKRKADRRKRHRIY